MMRSSLCLVLLLAASLWDAPAHADTVDSALDRAEDLLEKGDFAGAVAALLPHADEKNPKVDWVLADAMLLRATVGTQAGEMNAAAQAALTKAEECAARGNGGCMNVLYSAYSLGIGVQKDWPKALEHLRQAVTAGDAGARLNYAVMLYTGAPLVARDVDLACQYFVEQVNGPGAATAAYYLGLALYRGQCGRAVDPKGGMQLIQIAADHGIREAERDVAKNYEYGWTVKPDREHALEWYEKAAEHGDGEAAWKVGMAYVNGENRKPDSRRAFEYFERSAEAGYARGKISLAVMYVTGDGVPLDFAKAKALYEEAAADGEAHAYRELAIMYANGEGIPVDLVEARVLYEQSVLLEDSPNETFLANLETKMSKEQRDAATRRVEQWQAQREKKP